MTKRSTTKLLAALAVVGGFFYLMSYLPRAELASPVSVAEIHNEVWCSDSVNKDLGTNPRLVEWNWQGKTAAAFFPSGNEVNVGVESDGSVTFRRGGARTIHATFNESRGIVLDSSRRTGNMLGWLQTGQGYAYVTWDEDIRDLPSMSAECVANMFPNDPVMARVRALAKH